jgi:cell wall-associated NlpC family hydrolase
MGRGHALGGRLLRTGPDNIRRTWSDAISPEAIRPGDLLFFSGESTSGITHVAFAGEADTLIHSTLACGGTLVEPWLPGTRAGTLRQRLVAVRRLEER